MPELSRDELEQHLQEQLEFIKRSAEAFDSGHSGEAARLAVAVRVLINDTGRCKSLLTLLGRKEVEFCDTAVPFDRGNLGSHSGLVMVALGKGPQRPLALLDDGPPARKVPFSLWWDGVAFVDRIRSEFSRRDIVLNLADREGGAHVDPSLDDAYARLRKHNSLGWYDVCPPGRVTPAADQVPAAMRQIAHEILKTLEPNYTKHHDHKNQPGLLAMAPMLHRGNAPPPLPSQNPTKRRPLAAKAKAPRIGRNQPCPCGSGKKSKKCCGRKR
jgi:hypothetical protein